MVTVENEKSGRRIQIYIQPEVLERLDKHLDDLGEEVGQELSRSRTISNAIVAYLDRKEKGGGK